MKKIFKGITLSLAVLATVLTSMPASADEFYRHRRHNNNVNGGDLLAAGAIGLIAGAVIGGALSQPPRQQRRIYIDPPMYGDDQQFYSNRHIANPAFQQPDPYYSQPRQVYVDPYNDNGYYQQPRVIIRRQVYQPSVQYYHVKRRAQPVYNTYGSVQPWSQEWFDYCSMRYRTFNPQTGTFKGRHGKTYFCNAG